MFLLPAVPSQESQEVDAVGDLLKRVKAGEMPATWGGKSAKKSMDR
jgi:hypothetical protein